MTRSGNISIDDLSSAIADIMAEYTEDVEEGLEKAKNETANEGVKELKSTSPEKTGDYAKGWSKRKVGTAVVVHNRTDYRLTHLLEKGHANRDGTPSRKFVHIAPVEKHMIDSFEKKIEKVIKGEIG